MIAEMINRKVGWRGLAETLLLVVTVSLTYLCISWHGAVMRTNQDLHDVMKRLANTQSALTIARGKVPTIMLYTNNPTKGNP